MSDRDVSHVLQDGAVADGLVHLGTDSRHALTQLLVHQARGFGQGEHGAHRQRHEGDLTHTLTAPVGRLYTQAATERLALSVLLNCQY